MGEHPNTKYDLVTGCSGPKSGFTWAAIFEAGGSLAAEVKASTAKGLLEVLPVHGHYDPSDLQRVIAGLPQFNPQLFLDLLHI